jgi:hypothetical protein
MPRYAMNIGSLELQSEKPISAEERKRVLQKLRERDHAPILIAGDVYVVLSIPREC